MAYDPCCAVHVLGIFGFKENSVEGAVVILSQPTALKRSMTWIL